MRQSRGFKDRTHERASCTMFQEMPRSTDPLTDESPIRDAFGRLIARGALVVWPNYYVGTAYLCVGIVLGWDIKRADLAVRRIGHSWERLEQVVDGMPFDVTGNERVIRLSNPQRVCVIEAG